LQNVPNSSGYKRVEFGARDKENAVAQHNANAHPTKGLPKNNAMATLLNIAIEKAYILTAQLLRFARPNLSTIS
jgi:hypothetical protein